jgi:hypothetical protein
MLRSVRMVSICPALLFVGLVTLAAADSSFIVLPSEKIDENLLKKAEKVVSDLLSGWREGTFHHLSDDFSLEMIAGLPPEDQRKAYDSLRMLFGHFESLRFAEALISPRLPGAVMFRFKGTFSGTKDHPEIRVVVTDEGKITGFWVKHWADELE